MYTMVFLRQEPVCGLRREMPLLLEGVEQTITLDAEKSFVPVKRRTEGLRRTYSVSEARGN